MKYLHIVPPSVRMMNAFISSFREYYTEDKHLFLFINKCPLSETSLFSFGDVYELKGKNKIEKCKFLEKMFNKVDYIIWHGMMYSDKILAFCCRKKVLKKSIWIMWGIDLYNWADKCKKSSLSYKLNRYWRENVKYIVPLVQVDEKVYREQFPHSKAKSYTIPYHLSQETFSKMDSLSNWKPRPNGRLCVQIAHNAHSFNKHSEILDLISHFSQENLSIYIPASYGPEVADSAKYVSNITAKALSIFKKNVYILHNLIPNNEYTNFMWNMDVAIFNAERQNALGNIIKQLYLGNKVFLSKNCPTLKYLQEQGIEIYCTQNIKEMSFDEFSRPVDNTIAKQWVVDNYSLEVVLTKWDELFISLGGHKHSKKAHQVIGNVPSIPIYKDNLPYVYKALKWPFDIKACTPVAIIGNGVLAVSLYNAIKDLNNNKHDYHVLGIVETPNEKSFIGDSLALGNIDQVNLPENTIVLCSEINGKEREKIIAKIGKEYFINYPVFSYKSSVPAFFNAGNGCLFINNSNIFPRCTIGDGVIIISASVKNDTIIKDYATIQSGCKIDSFCNIGKYSMINENVLIHSFSTIGNNVIVQNKTEIGHCVTIDDDSTICVSATIGAMLNSESPCKDLSVTLGKHCYVSYNASIGSSISIGNNCRIGVNSEIDNYTRIGDNVYIGNEVKINHSVVIGSNCTIEDCVTIPPFTIIPDGTTVRNVPTDR